MAKAQEGSNVEVHYTGTLEDESVFDTSKERGPLPFKVGEGKVIPGFEQAVVGMEEGETKNVSLAPDEAYGDHQEQLIMQVEKNEIPEGIEVGSVLQADMQGQPVYFTVTEIGDEKVTVDGNHPLAGKKLNFEIELVKTD